MDGFDVAVWLCSLERWPEIVLLVHAPTAGEAVMLVLQARHVSHAVKVAVNAGDGVIQRWYEVTTLLDGFGYQHEEVSVYGLL
jgi:hypothetical protein